MPRQPGMVYKDDPGQIAFRRELERKADILKNGWVTRLLRWLSGRR